MASIDSFVAVCGAVQGLALSVAVGTARRGEPATNRALGMVLGGGAVAVGAIALSHAAWLPAASTWAPLLQLLETAATLVAGPLLLLYVLRVHGRGAELGPRFALHFAPAALWLAYAGPAVVRALAAGSAPRLAWPPILPLIAYQVLYSAAAVSLAVRHRRLAAAGAERWRTWSLLAFMLALHVAQAVRFGFHDVAALRNVVPLVGAAGFFVLTFAGLRRNALLLRPAPPLRGASRSPGPGPAVVLADDERTRRVAERLRHALEVERRYLDPELDLAGLAAEVGVPRTLLSRLLNQHFGRGFLDLIHGYRVRDAVALLSDPDAAHLTVDAVAERCGFRSRSTFYAAFRRHTGTTPSRLRDGSG
jgi:AraC-like DNA-binding protein